VGLTVLYAAFVMVALWLLGELLLQRRAPLPWRALALAGFLTLVLGVVQGSLPLIAGGVLGFGAGQALATRALKAGGGPYWTLLPAEQIPVVGRLFGADAGGAGAPGRPEPEPEVVGEVGPIEAMPPVVGATAVHQPQELVAEEGVYYGYAEQEQQAAYYAYTPEQQAAYAQYAQQSVQAYAEHGQYPQYQEQQPYAGAYQSGYEVGQQTEHQQYAGYQPEYQQQTDYAQQPAPVAYGYDYEQAQYYYPSEQQHQQTHGG
jgi:hypothetical protein